MPEQPNEGWLSLIRYFDDIRAENRMASEAIHALQERLDDWDREQEIKRLTFEQKLLAQVGASGKDAEQAQREVEDTKAAMLAFQSESRSQFKQFTDALQTQRAVDLNTLRGEIKQVSDSKTTVTVARITSRTQIVVALLGMIAASGLVTLLFNLLTHKP